MVNGIGQEPQQVSQPKKGVGIIGGTITAAAGAGVGYMASNVSGPVMQQSYYKGIIDGGEDKFVKTIVDDAAATAQRIGADVEAVKTSTTTTAKEAFAQVATAAKEIKGKARNAKILFAAGGAALFLGAAVLVKKLVGDKKETAETPPQETPPAGLHPEVQMPVVQPPVEQAHG